MSVIDENDEQPFISFGGLRLKLIYPFIMGISHVIISISYEFLSKVKIYNAQKVMFKEHNFFIIFVMFLGEFLVGFIYIIQLILSKHQQTKETQLEKINIETKTKIKQFFKLTFLIFICFFVDFIRNVAVALI